MARSVALCVKPHHSQSRDHLNKLQPLCMRVLTVTEMETEQAHHLYNRKKNPMFLCSDPSYRDYGNKGIKEDRRGRMCIYAHTRAREDTRYISMLKDEKHIGKRERAKRGGMFDRNCLAEQSAIG